MTKKLKLRPFVLPSIYLILVVMLLLVSLYSYNSLTSDKTTESVEDVNYVSDTNLNSEDTPVVSSGKTIIKPVNDENVKIAKYFYEKDAEEVKQQESIVYYGNTYMQNSGIDYISDKDFDVITILDGTITSIKDDELLGKTVEIKHDNKLVSIYQGLGEISVKEGDNVTAGNVIAKSGESTLSDIKGKHLHFELIYDGEVVNPLSFFDKNVNDL